MALPFPHHHHRRTQVSLDVLFLLLHLRGLQASRRLGILHCPQGPISSFLTPCICSRDIQRYPKKKE